MRDRLRVAVSVHPTTRKRISDKFHALKQVPLDFTCNAVAALPALPLHGCACLVLSSSWARAFGSSSKQARTKSRPASASICCCSTYKGTYMHIHAHTCTCTTDTRHQTHISIVQAGVVITHACIMKQQRFCTLSCCRERMVCTQ